MQAEAVAGCRVRCLMSILHGVLRPTRSGGGPEDAMQNGQRSKCCTGPSDNSTASCFESFCCDCFMWTAVTWPCCNVVLDHLIAPLFLAVSCTVVTGSCEQQWPGYGVMFQTTSTEWWHRTVWARRPVHGATDAHGREVGNSIFTHLLYYLLDSSNNYWYGTEKLQ